MIEQKVDFLRIFLLTSFLILIGYLVHYMYVRLRICYYLGKIRGPKRNFFWGNMFTLHVPIEDIYKILNEWGKQYYPAYGLRLAYHGGLNLFSPEDFEIVMSSKKHHEKTEMYLVMYDWLKEGLLNSFGEKWFQRRKILTPAFHFSVLKDFIGVFIEETNNLVNNTIPKYGTEAFDIVPMLKLFALSSMNETAMGQKLDLEKPEHRIYRQAITDIQNVYIYRLLRPWFFVRLTWFFVKQCYQEMRLLNILHGYTQKIVKNKEKVFKGVEQRIVDEQEQFYGKSKRLAMLDILLQAKQNHQIDHMGICEEVDTFLFEGHDTSATALSFTLMLIASHPTIQDQLVEEIHSIIGPDDFKPSYDNLNKLDLLERVIKESLRLYPPVWIIGRRASEDFKLHTGELIPYGSTILLHIYALHKLPEIYPDPEKFDPDRFLPENCQKRHPYAYVPFSAGPRNCIGQRFAMLELKVAISGILRKYRLLPVDTPETVVLGCELILKAVNGIKLKFVPRN